MDRDELILKSYVLMDACAKGELLIQGMHNQKINVTTHPYGIPLLNRRFAELSEVFQSLINIGIDPESLINQWEAESSVAKQWLGAK